MKNICAIFDVDEQYAGKLMNAINSVKGIMYRAIMFTNWEALDAYLEKETLQLLVIGEEVDVKKDVSTLADKVIILRENNFDCKDGDTFSVYKYQPACKLVTAIIGNSGTNVLSASADRQIVGVYSPIHYAGKTSFSLALAKAYARQGARTLYLNLEEFSGLSEILPDNGEGNLSDALYYYRTGPERFTEEFKRLVCMAGDISYIPPIKCAEDISALSTREWMDFILHIAGTGIFDVIVLDAANALGEPWNILEVCTRVIMPVREDYISRQKINDFDACMSAMGKDKICRITEKMLLPRDGNAEMSKDFLDMVEYGTLGKHARQIV